MSEMVDRVAKAIALQSHAESPCLEDLARRAIEAMREPTEAMVCAGDEQIIVALNDHGGVRRDPTPAQGTWVSMIDEALK